MSEEIAGADKLEVFLKVFGDQPAGTVLETVVFLVVEDTFQEQVDFFAVRIHLKVVFFREFFYRLQKFFFVGFDCEGSCHCLNFCGGDLHVGILHPTGRADLRRIDAVMNVVADETPPVFFHVIVPIVFYNGLTRIMGLNRLGHFLFQFRLSRAVIAVLEAHLLIDRAIGADAALFLSDDLAFSDQGMTEAEFRFIRNISGTGLADAHGFDQG